MRRDTLKLLLGLGLAGIAGWLWFTRSGKQAALSTGHVAASGALVVTEAVKPFLDRAMAWLGTQQAKANLLALWPAISKAADSVGMPPLVLARVVFIESGFRSDVIEKRLLGKDGEIGLTQVIPKWHPTIDLSTPESQLYGTARDMAADYKRFGRWDAAVAAWNAGPGVVAAALKTGEGWRSKLPSITQAYLTKLDAGLA